MNELAYVIVERKEGHFRPEQFIDRYEDAVVELIRAKQAGMPAKVAAEQPTRLSNVVSILDALRKSIAVETAKAPVVKSNPKRRPPKRLPPSRNPRFYPKPGARAAAAPATASRMPRKAE
jgi:DNA end-binding protein Ku